MGDTGVKIRQHTAEERSREQAMDGLRKNVQGVLERHAARNPDAVIIVSLVDGRAVCDVSNFADIRELTFAHKLMDTYVHESFALSIAQTRMNAAKDQLASHRAAGGEQQPAPKVEKAAAGLPEPVSGAV